MPARSRRPTTTPPPPPRPRQGWLILVYRVPRQPTRLRAAVWRRLKAHGAVYLQDSVVALPDIGGRERALRTLRREILGMGGSAFLVRSDAITSGRDLVEVYNAARNEEYDEIVDRCKDFLAEIQNETATGHFTYAELEENDEDLVKLRRWFDKVAARDVLGAVRRRAAVGSIGECTVALEGFAARVYDAEDAQ